ncbi:unnamed protein product, partial [Rotaria sordida]
MSIPSSFHNDNDTVVYHLGEDMGVCVDVGA